MIAYLVGAVGYGLGLVVSSITDLPSGAVIVWALVVSALSFKMVFSYRVKVIALTQTNL